MCFWPNGIAVLPILPELVISVFFWGKIATDGYVACVASIQHEIFAQEAFAQTLSNKNALYCMWIIALHKWHISFHAYITCICNSESAFLSSCLSACLSVCLSALAHTVDLPSTACTQTTMFKLQHMFLSHAATVMVRASRSGYFVCVFCSIFRPTQST